MAEKKEYSFAGVENAGRIHARILDVHTGLKELSEVYAIRVHDEKVHRLFMNDYAPTLGKIRGDVILLCPAGEYACRGIAGFFKLQHNEFTLLVEEHLHEEAVVE